ncbi:MAG: hypothetical protein HUJ58_05055 [Erysipelotrichaceae bacterium]|nr:hypothetical protein [Erysipelotrichaceae bacterium]
MEAFEVVYQSVVMACLVVIAASCIVFPVLLLRQRHKQFKEFMNKPK